MSNISTTLARDRWNMVSPILAFCFLLKCLVSLCQMLSIFPKAFMVVHTSGKSICLKVFTQWKNIINKWCRFLMTANIAKIVCPRTFTQSLVAKGSLQDLQVSLATIALQFKENMLQAHKEEAFSVQKEQQSRNISLLMSMSDQNRQIKQQRSQQTCSQQIKKNSFS